MEEARLTALMDDIARCRNFARQCRQLAEAAPKPTAKMLLSLANDYEDLADEMGRTEKPVLEGPPIA